MDGNELLVDDGIDQKLDGRRRCIKIFKVMKVYTWMKTVQERNDWRSVVEKAKTHVV